MVFVAEEMTAIQFEMARNASKYPLGEDEIAEIMCDLVAKREGRAAFLLIMAWYQKGFRDRTL